MKIISEVGINHNGDFRYIEELVRLSAAGGADFAKFQLYSSQRVFGDDSRKRNEFTFSQVETIVRICQHYGIEFFASVFDEEKLQWCETLGVNYYKIASRTVVKEPDLCRQILDLGKPTFVSLGFWEQQELPLADYPNVQYLNCISKYPTTCLDIRPMRPYSGSVVGFSDHSYGVGFCLHQIAHGARVIEKHFTMNKSMEGNDHIGSMTYEELQTLRQLGDQLCAIQRQITAPESD